MRLCRRCGRPLTAQQARQALGRLLAAGMALPEAARRSPSCFRCAGLLIRGRVAAATNQEESYANR